MRLGHGRLLTVTLTIRLNVDLFMLVVAALAAANPRSRSLINVVIRHVFDVTL